jgi:D-arabinose 1-dehydrogenase-like Zn-dependent alcohol dehydrogenase
LAREPSLACGTCRHGRSGRDGICEILRVMGFQAPGGMAGAFVAPIDRLHRLPGERGFDVTLEGVGTEGALRGASLKVAPTP